MGFSCTSSGQIAGIVAGKFVRTIAVHEVPRVSPGTWPGDALLPLRAGAGDTECFNAPHRKN
jgi:hypothetical protein